VAAGEDMGTVSASVTRGMTMGSRADSRTEEMLIVSASITGCSKSWRRMGLWTDCMLRRTRCARLLEGIRVSIVDTAIVDARGVEGSGGCYRYEKEEAGGGIASIN